MMQPKSDWCWQYDHEYDCLQLDMGEFLFATPYSKRKLEPTCLDMQSFSVADSDLYEHFYHTLEDCLGLPEALMVQMALNAVALAKFTKPGGPKSWYLNEMTDSAPGLLDEVVAMESDRGKGVFLIIERNANASLFMLLSTSMALNGGNMLKQFEPFRAMNDRMALYIEKAQLSQFFSQDI